MSTTWHKAATNPPPVNTEVLLALRSEVGQPAAVGVRVAYPRRPSRTRYYRLADDHARGPEDVYAWAELPTPPTPEQLGLAPSLP